MANERLAPTREQKEAFYSLTKSPKFGFGACRSARPLSEITQISEPIGFVPLSKPLIENGLTIACPSLARLAKEGLVTMNEGGFIQPGTDEVRLAMDYGIVYHFDANGRLAGEDFYIL